MNLKFTSYVRHKKHFVGATAKLRGQLQGQSCPHECLVQTTLPLNIQVLVFHSEWWLDRR
jgi:hypothetical protein